MYVCVMRRSTDSWCMYLWSLILMHVCMRHVSMILDLDECGYAADLYDASRYDAFRYDSCMYDACIYDPWSLIIDPDAYMYDAYIYDPWSWCMCVWRRYEWCIYPWSLTLIHVFMMRISMILDPDACVLLCVWCTYVCCMHLWSFTLIHVFIINNLWCGIYSWRTNRRRRWFKELDSDATFALNHA